MAEVEVTPEALRFRFALNKQLLATITINNPMDTRAGFKIKTTAPKKYVVRPSSGVAEPHASVSVQVIMQAQKEHPHDFANCKDKFMVQLVQLGEDEQIDKDTFSKETRKDLKEARLRVIMEGPAAPPSPVPEAHAEGPDAVEQAPSAAVPQVPQASSDARLRSTLNDLSSVSSENTQLKVQVDRMTRERDELRKKLDMIELQAGSAKSVGRQSGDASQTPLQFRANMLLVIIAAFISFLIGHYLR